VLSVSGITPVCNGAVGATGPQGAQGPQGPPGPGSVTAVGSGFGLTGGPITTTGSLAIDTLVVPVLSGANTFTGAQAVVSPTSSAVPFTVRGATGQTADLTQWRNAAGTTVASLSAAGVFSGSGAGLTALPAGQLTGVVPGAALAGTYPNNLTLSGAGNSITANTASITNLTSSSTTITNLTGTNTVTFSGATVNLASASLTLTSASISGGTFTSGSFSGTHTGNGADLTGLPLAQFGERDMAPCTFDGTARTVACSGACTWSTVDGDVTCGSTPATGCSATVVGSGVVCPSSGACALSCVDGLSNSGVGKIGWAFAQTNTGAVRLVTIPAARGSMTTGRLFVQLRHPLLVCTPSATAFHVPVTMYLYRGGSVEPALVIWRGTIRTFGGVGGLRDFVPEMPPLQGEVTVTPGARYSIWVQVGPLDTDVEHCYLARLTTDASNLLVRYTPGSSSTF
jgi:hypothetical protein